MSEAAKKQADAYQVGYGKPPVETRFRKGQSGNPSGRPRRKEIERAKDIALQEAYRLVTVRDGDGFKKIPAIQAVHRAQVALAAKGNGPAQRAFLRIVQGIEAEKQELLLDLLKSTIEYRARAEETQEKGRLGLIEDSPLLPHPDDVVIDFQTGDVAMAHPDFLKRPSK